MADLITLDRLLDALNKIPADMEAQEIDKYNAAIASASAAVRAYADRDFTLNNSAVATTRTFEYDDSGYIDIDDAQSVTTVVVSFAYGGSLTLSSYQWQAYPYNAEIKDSILVYYPEFFPGSTEMGFTYNLDRYEGDRKSVV